MEDTTDFSEVEASRRCAPLLQYYNFQTMTHEGYFIALLIGFPTLISRWAAFAKNISFSVLFFVTTSSLTALGAYIVVGTLSRGAHEREKHTKERKLEIPLLWHKTYYMAPRSCPLV